MPIHTQYIYDQKSSSVLEERNKSHFYDESIICYMIRYYSDGNHDYRTHFSVRILILTNHLVTNDLGKPKAKLFPINAIGSITYKKITRILKEKMTQLLIEASLEDDIRYLNIDL